MIEVKVKKQMGNFLLQSELCDSGVICLTGPNGSGKSSLLNVISGLIKPDEGYVKLNSRDITRLPIEKREIVLVTPESYIPNLEVEKHLTWGATVKGVTPDKIFIDNVRQQLGVSFNGKVGKLSLGMKERVSLATALLSSPSAILVDETFSNIDHREQFIEAFSILARAKNLDVIFTTQNLDDSRLAEHHYKMNAGTVGKDF